MLFPTPLADINFKRGLVLDYTFLLDYTFEFRQLLLYEDLSADYHMLMYKQYCIVIKDKDLIRCTRQNLPSAKIILAKAKRNGCRLFKYTFEYQ